MLWKLYIAFLHAKLTFKTYTPVSQTRLKPSPRLKCKSELFQLKRTYTDWSYNISISCLSLFYPCMCSWFSLYGILSCSCLVWLLYDSLHLNSLLSLITPHLFQFSLITLHVFISPVFSSCSFFPVCSPPQQWTLPLVSPP